VVTDPRLGESSGLAVSPADPDLLYMVNDSGNAPIVYVIDRRDGAVVGTTTLVGLPGDADPEALAVDADTLWVADTGDNLDTRDDVALYAVPAPGRGDTTVTPLAYPVSYSGYDADVETLLADPASGTMWVVTKGWLGGSLLRFPDAPAADADNRLRPVPGVQVPSFVTDGTVLADGSAVVLRTYERGYVYRLPDWERVGDFALPRQEQGESLTALPDGSLLAGSEGTPARIDHVRLPPSVVAALAPDELTPGATTIPGPTSTPTATADPASGDAPAGVLRAALAVAAMLAAGGLAVALVRRLT